MEKLHISVSPHVRSSITTQKIMLDVVIALIPAAIAGCIIFGLSALWIILACVLSSVAFEALFNDKTCVDRHMSEHGKIITNFDDEAIANHSFIHPVVSFGINTPKKVDYRAVNITEAADTLTFDVVSDTTNQFIFMMRIFFKSLSNCIFKIFRFKN